MDPLVEPVDALTSAEHERTARHQRLLQLGPIGQRRLAAARVAVLGAGGLGGPALLSLAAAGIGTIGIFDDDVVEVSNLQRQLVHGIADVGRPKVDSAAETIALLAPECVVQRHPLRLTDANAAEHLAGYDLVVDGTDNFATRYLADRVAARLGVPLVWTAVLGFDAQLSVFWANAPGGGVRLTDLFPDANDDDGQTCATAGVLGPLCAQLGGLIATEVVKLVTGIGEPLLGRVLVIDALRATQREVPLSPADAATRAAPPVEPNMIAPDELVARLASTVPPLILDVREHDEYAAQHITAARLVPLSGFDAVRLQNDGLDPAAPLVVHCQLNPRAREAARRLLRAGFTDVSVLDGGIEAWARTQSVEQGVTA